MNKLTLLHMKRKWAYRNPWTLDTSIGRSTLDAGPWTLDATLWMLGYWALNTIVDCFKTKSEASF